MAGKVRSKVPANAVHPGEILWEEFMVPLGLKSTEPAKQLHITVPRVNELVRGRRSMTADVAMRLARYFGTSATVWVITPSLRRRLLKQRMSLQPLRSRLRARSEPVEELVEH